MNHFETVRIYVIADIHGRVDLLCPLLTAIQEDADQSPQTNCVLITLGDYIDRGPDSRAVIDLLLHQSLPGFSKQFLKGNHEDMLLKFLNNPEQGELWIRNGGDATLMSYGVLIERRPSVNQIDRALCDLRDALLKNMPDRHLRFLESLSLFYQFKEYFFVHGGVRPDIPLAEQSEEDLMWIRQEFLNYSKDFEKIIVHGHSIVKNPEIKHNRIALDTGAFYTGKLTCLVLNGGERFFLQTQETADFTP